MPALIVAGTHSGAGKTTVSLVLMAALRERGYRVQPFKIGPDFIDPGYHRVVAGRESINLDLWMMGLANLRRSFRKFSSGADVAVIESMGALFDGENGTRERGSAGYIARTLGVPVVLVVDIWGMTRSTRALLEGFLGFDPRIRVAGIVFNQAGSSRHFEMVLASLPPHLRKLSLGYIPHSSRLCIPERHLGLLTVEENALGPHTREEVLREAGRTLDVEKLVRVLRIARRPVAAAPVAPRHSKPRPRLAIARDEAFCFYYLENLQMLEEAGAELCFFSPLRDSRLPPDVDGVYLGGGYPESFAADLARNTGLRQELTTRAEEGMPIYAECGGLMYLGRSLTDFEGNRHAMASVLPLDFVMDRSHLAIRYVEVRTMVPTILGPANTVARGQEFHQSRLLHASGRRAYAVTSSTGESHRDGFVRKNTLGSYIHLHWAMHPAIPTSLVQSARRSMPVGH